MALATGSRLGPYEVVAPLGAGGMGEVYRARDTRLDRTVAIKVLAPDLASDKEFRQRFLAEARAISQLTHPHICTLHDIGEHGGTTFLVMELLTGETLAARLARGTPAQSALTLDQAVQIGIQIAEALAAAHAHGIVHRDLKPGNIMLTKGAASSAVHAKLLDFGLAKATPVVTGTGGTLAPTTPPQAVTAHGSIVGTIQYMAPEQVAGGAVDARTDIFALGSVLYELLTGRQAFEGKSQAHVMAAILEREPPAVSALQPRVPALVEATVTKCLAKHPDERWQSAADLATALRWASGPGATAVEASSAAGRVGPRTSPARLAALILLAAGLGAAVTAVVARYPGNDTPPPRTMRFEIQAPANAHWSPAPVSSTAQMALAPNGEHLAFVAAAKGATSRIWIRALRAVEARELPDTNGAAFPLWSPDSRHVAFFADGKLKKVDVSGGRPQILADAPAGRGGTWGPNGIVFTPAPSQGLFHVSAEGGAVTELTSPGSMGGVTHYWPQFLPDGQRVIFYQRSGETGTQGIYVVDLRSKSARAVMVHDGRAIYAAEHFLTVRDGMLFSQPVDEQSLSPRGEPIRLAEQVGHFGGTFGDASVTVSNNGILVFGPRIVMVTSLQWRDRSGGVITQATTPGAAYRSPLLAPGEKMAVFSLLDPARSEGPDIWMAELGRGILTRLTTDPRNDWFPVWSSDGSYLFFGSTRGGSTGLFRKTPSASAPDEPLTEPTQFGRYPTDVTRDGTTLLYHEVAQQGYDLGLIETTGARTARKVLATRFNEVQGRLSPDQRWMAYASDESGRFEVYVRPFPEGSAQTTVSIAGGMQPRWRGDGKELFYLTPSGHLMAVAVTSDGPGFSAAAPQALFSIEVPEPSAPFPTDYDVSADGRRFLVNTVAEQATRPSVTVILNWTADLTRR